MFFLQDITTAAGAAATTTIAATAAATSTTTTIIVTTAASAAATTPILKVHNYYHQDYCYNHFCALTLIIGFLLNYRVSRKISGTFY